MSKNLIGFVFFFGINYFYIVFVNVRWQVFFFKEFVLVQILYIIVVENFLFLVVVNYKFYFGELIYYFVLYVYLIIVLIIVWCEGICDKDFVYFIVFIGFYVYCGCQGILVDFIGYNYLKS